MVDDQGQAVLAPQPERVLDVHPPVGNRHDRLQQAGRIATSQRAGGNTHGNGQQQDQTDDSDAVLGETGSEPGELAPGRSMTLRGLADVVVNDVQSSIQVVADDRLDGRLVVNIQREAGAELVADTAGGSGGLRTALISKAAEVVFNDIFDRASNSTP